MKLSEVVTMKVLKKVRVNPIQVGGLDPSIDLQSKVFLISQTLLGVNRIALFPNVHKVYIHIASGYALLTVAITLFVNQSIDMETYLIILQYIANVVLAFAFSKRMRNYYIELAKFDRAVGCRPKKSLKIYSKITYNILTILFTGLNFYLSQILDVVVYNMPLTLLGVYMVQFTEIYFCGHLFDLLLPRLQLINAYVESSFVFDYPSKSIMQEFEVFAPIRENSVKMKHVMDWYQVIVSAHDLLVHAIKWQVLIIITLSFVSLLSFSYRVALIVMHGTRNVLGALLNIGMLLAFLATMVAPCASSEHVHYKAVRLRELLATRLYDNKLDKYSRNSARALLALTESRDLSFSLMNMFTVGVSLPFTFTSLLITYLIILLQFEKVMHGQTHAEN